MLEPVLEANRRAFARLQQIQIRAFFVFVLLAGAAAFGAPVDWIPNVFGAVFVGFCLVFGFLELQKFRVYKRDLRDRHSSH